MEEKQVQQEKNVTSKPKKISKRMLIVLAFLLVFIIRSCVSYRSEYL